MQPPKWNFFRAGGFEQLLIESAADLQALPTLDQKLWATLACPVHSLAMDARLLSYLDTNEDGRLRAPEVLATLEWLLEHLVSGDELFNQQPLYLSSFRDNHAGQHLAKVARRLLHLKGRNEDDSLTSADTQNFAELFPANAPNGDGVLPLALAPSAEVAAAIQDIMKSVGSQQDRSGELGVNAAQIEQFYGQLAEVHAWYFSVDASVREPLLEKTVQAAAVFSQLHDKIEDYFTRVAMVAFEPQSAGLMVSQESELTRLAALNLSDKTLLADLPLAGLQHGDQLPLQHGLNPAWQGLMEQFYRSLVVPLIGEHEYLTLTQWQSIQASLAAYFAWQTQQPKVAVLEQFSVAEALSKLDHHQQAAFERLMQEEQSVEEAASGLVELDKLLRLKENFVTLLRNYISFQNFYLQREASLFQAGELYIDGKTLELVVEVKDIDAHSAVAASSNSFLIYCECKRPKMAVNGREKMYIVAAVTAGTEQALMVGRNGLFYDRAGNDWDATVVKVIENAISVREAFWSPYKRLVNLISNQIQKFASSRDDALVKDSLKQLETLNTESTAPASNSFDIARFAGVFAAIGLAVGALGTALAAMFSSLMTLVWWQWPLTVLGIMLVISGPSMLMAWFKLRRRSLGPILDANGWAVNTQAKISIGFGASLTQVARLPKQARLLIQDPYAHRSVRRYFWWALLVSSLLSAALWFVLNPSMSLF